MTTTIFNAIPLPTTANDASWRAWGSAFSAGLAAIGLVKTADTGQVDWTTTTYVANTNSYEIWRFNDTLQSTRPVYLKVSYNSNTNGFNFGVTVGTSTNGSGTLSGTTSSGYSLTGLNNNLGINQSYPFYLSGDGSYCCLALEVGASQNAYGQGLFIVERTRDSSGVATSDGLVIIIYGQNAAASLVWNFTAGTTTSVNAGLAPINASGNLGATQYVYPLLPTQLSVAPNPLLAAVGYWTSDIPRGVTFSVTVSGASHTYFCPAVAQVQAQLNSSGTGSANYAMRWE